MMSMPISCDAAGSSSERGTNAGEDEAASERPSRISSTTSLLVLRPMSSVFTIVRISPRFTTGYCRCKSAQHDAPDWQSTSIRIKVGCRKALSRRPVSDVDDTTRRTPDGYRKYLRHKMFENQSRQRPRVTAVSTRSSRSSASPPIRRTSSSSGMYPPGSHNPESKRGPVFRGTGDPTPLVWSSAPLTPRSFWVRLVQA